MLTFKLSDLLLWYVKNFDNFMQLTKFGKVIRKLRIEYDMLLGEMAKKIGISSSYLSSIEIGEREIPQNFFEKIKQLNIFSNEDLKDIQSSIDETIKTFSFQPKTEKQRNLIAGFARSFDNLSEEQVKAIQDILKNKENHE